MLYHNGVAFAAFANITVYNETLEWTSTASKAHTFLSIPGCIRLRLFLSGSSNLLEHLFNFNSCFSHLGESPRSLRSSDENLTPFIRYVWTSWREVANYQNYDLIIGAQPDRCNISGLDLTTGQDLIRALPGSHQSWPGLCCNVMLVFR